MGSFSTGMGRANRPPTVRMYQIGSDMRPEARQLPPPPPDAYAEREMQATLPPPPVEPKPPARPKRHGFWCRQLHPDKQKEADRSYGRKLQQYQAEHEQWDRQIADYCHQKVVVPGLPKPEMSLTEEEKAFVESEKELSRFDGEIGAERLKVSEAQGRCEQAKAQAKACLREKDQTEMAKTFITDFLLARRQLERAVKSYQDATLQLDAMVEAREKYKNSINDKRRTEIMETLGVATAENLEEAKAVRDGLTSFNLPKSFYPQARRDNENEIQALMREFTEEAAQDARTALGPLPTPAPEQMGALPQRVPQFN